MSAFLYIFLGTKVSILFRLFIFSCWLTPKRFAVTQWILIRSQIPEKVVKEHATTATATATTAVAAATTVATITTTVIMYAFSSDNSTFASDPSPVSLL